MPAGPESLKIHFKTVSYVPDAMMLALVIVALIYGNQSFLYLPGVFLFLGTVAGATALHLGWATPFRLLFGLVTILSAFWTQMGTASPFYVGWAVLILGRNSVGPVAALATLRKMLRPREGGGLAVPLTRFHLRPKGHVSASETGSGLTVQGSRLKKVSSLMDGGFPEEDLPVMTPEMKSWCCRDCMKIRIIQHCSGQVKKVFNV